MVEMLPEMPSRRQRARADTLLEIRTTARRVLVDRGVDGLALRAVAREMGMTAPALYRYFSSREDLFRHVCGDIFSEIATGIRAASARAAEESGGDVTAKLIAACREFRHWALTHREEFGLLFGTPVPGLEPLHNDKIDECALDFAGSWMSLFLELWQRHPFPVQPDDQIEPGLLAQLARYLDGLGADLPAGAVLIFLRCWVRLYGMVSLEVFEHLRFALDDAGPLFEYTLAELADLVGLDYPPLR